MPTITLTISAAHSTRFINAMKGLHAYQETIDDEPNTENEGDFAKRMLKQRLVSLVRRWEHRQALDDVVTEEISVDVA